ncbi:regulatory transcription factor Rfx isoform X2 [Arctopsyche grandis]|uniref:regulatory transcription factor Rfx isoform X2 n=1 Tax=Arctopsyche grandis TaxID=121162 RepID=UPI00406D70C8
MHVWVWAYVWRMCAMRMRIPSSVRGRARSLGDWPSNGTTRRRCRDAPVAASPLRPLRPRHPRGAPMAADFDCPTDEIIVEQPASASGRIIIKCEKDDKVGESGLPLFAVSVDADMSARLATQAYSSPRQLDNINDPLAISAEEGDDDHRGGDDASVELENEHVGRDVIVIPANANSVELQRAIQQVSANGVTVLDVRSLRGDSAQSSPGGEQQVVVQAGEGQHFIAVTGDGGVGYHVQYVEPQELYTQAQGQTQMTTYPVYAVGEGGSVYTGGAGGASVANSSAVGTNSSGQWNTYTTTQHPTTHHYLLSSTAIEDSPSVSVTQMHKASPQTLTADVSYLSAGAQDQQASPQSTALATRSSPATVKWLTDNYENAEGVSLPRSTLYSYYLGHCAQRDLEPVNAASFGKLIRSVFMGLRTRRLGTRGNSKYHYYGIRVKPGSPLSNSTMNYDSGGGGDSTGNVPNNKISGNRFTNRAGTSTPQSRNDSTQSLNSNPHMHQHHQYLGDGNGAIPNFPEIQFTGSLPGDCTLEDVDTLRSIYREHCEAFLDAVLSLELSTVESLWREFWRQNNNNDPDECEEEKYLSKTKLYQLCGMTEIQEWVRAVDVAFYQRLVQVLLPDVLRPIPSPLTQAIRNFAKGLESWLVSAMSGCPAGMIRAKTSPAAAMAQSLRRYTSLNHLAQAARAVLHNSQQIHQMLADLNRVDFHNVQEQASWVCQCPVNMVTALEADFKRTLQRQASLEQWAAWLETTVCRALRPHENSPNYAHHARQFLLKWSFYSSMVIRDLTLRSAASFGSFHLIRLLYDEYMFYLIEHRVAAHRGSAPIQVMAEDLMNGSSESDEQDSGDYKEMILNIPMKNEGPTPPKKMKIS